MISKATRGKGFSGSISYICVKSDHVVTRNIIGDDWRKAAGQMRLIVDANPKSGKPVYHSWLSFKPDERLSDEQMVEAMDLMLQKLNLDHHQSVFAVHKDRDHWHIHCVTNLISPSGEYNHVSHDFRKRPAFARQIEIEMDLKRYSCKEQNTNQVSAERIAEVQKVLAEARSTDDFRRQLEQIGIQLDEKSSRGRALNFRVIDSETGSHIPGSRIDAVLSSPTTLKKHFSSSQKAPVQQVSTTSKTTWDTSRNAAIQRVAAASKGWDELRKNLSGEGLSVEIIERENGAKGVVFSDDAGNRIAASKVSSDLSYGRLSKRFDQPQPQTVEAQNDKAKKRVPPSTSMEKSPWQQYSEARDGHFSRLGKTPDDLKSEALRIKADRERLWRDYKARTSLIPQCFSPQYRRIMREVERDHFEKAKRSLDRRSAALRSSRFPSFRVWKDGPVLPTIQPKTIWQKIRSFFEPRSEASAHYHRNHTYRPPPTVAAAPPPLRPAITATTSDGSSNDFFALMSKVKLSPAQMAEAETFGQRASAKFQNRQPQQWSANHER